MSDLEQAAGRAEKQAIGADLVIPLIGSGLAIYYLVSTAELDWEAKSSGMFVGTVLLALCVMQFIRLIGAAVAGRATLRLGELIADTTHNRQRLGLVVLVTLFIATISWTGTTLGLFLLILASLWVMGVRAPRHLLGISVTTSLVVYALLIYLLDTRLPRGLIEKTIAAALGQGS